MATCSLGGMALKGIVAAVPHCVKSFDKLSADLAHISFDEINAMRHTLGMKQCYRAETQTTSDLCVAAAQELMERLRWDRASVDGLLFVTQTPNMKLPSTACIIHEQLGLLSECIAFDVNLGCTGFIYGLWMAAQFINSKACSRVLLLVGDTLSKSVSPNDHNSYLSYGDACAAVALESSSIAESVTFQLYSDGTGHKNLTLHENRGNDQYSYLQTNGWELLNFTFKRVPHVIHSVLSLHGWSMSDVDYFLLHQPNKFTVQKLAQKCGIPEEKLPISFCEYGNISGATIPVLFVDLKNRLEKSQANRFLLAAYGVGYSWAAAALTVKTVDVLDLMVVS